MENQKVEIDSNNKTKIDEIVYLFVNLQNFIYICFTALIVILLLITQPFEKIENIVYLAVGGGLGVSGTGTSKSK